MWGRSNPIMVGGTGYEGYTVECKYNLVRNAGSFSKKNFLFRNYNNFSTGIIKIDSIENCEKVINMYNSMQSREFHYNFFSID